MSAIRVSNLSSTGAITGSPVSGTPGEVLYEYRFGLTTDQTFTGTTNNPLSGSTVTVNYPSGVSGTMILEITCSGRYRNVSTAVVGFEIKIATVNERVVYIETSGTAPSGSFFIKYTREITSGSYAVVINAYSSTGTLTLLGNSSEGCYKIYRPAATNSSTGTG